MFLSVSQVKASQVSALVLYQGESAFPRCMSHLVFSPMCLTGANQKSSRPGEQFTTVSKLIQPHFT